MCGGVRGVSAGGIVSSAYCLLYKLYTLKLSKKQVRIIYFMFLRLKVNLSSGDGPHQPLRLTVHQGPGLHVP